MKSTRFIRRWIVAAAALLTMPAIAEASCVQGDATGQWMTYSMNSDGGGVRCRIFVASNGNISSGTCSGPGGTFGVQSGYIRALSPGLCTFNGSIKINGVINTVTHATMSQEKTVVQGLGKYSGGGFVFSMVKI